METQTDGADPAGGVEGDDSFARQEAMRQFDSGSELETRGEPENALRCYDQAIRWWPGFGRAHFCRGNVLLEIGNATEALNAYAAALHCKPDSAAAHYNMGNAHARLGNSEQALACYQAAIVLKPDFADAWVASGAALEELGQLDEAADHYRLALEVQPVYAEAYFNLGGVQEKAGKLDEAEASYRRALEIKPGYAEAHCHLAVVLKELGRISEALASIRRALEINPEYLLAQSMLVFHQHYLAGAASADRFAEARHYGEIASRHVAQYSEWASVPDPDRRLRVGLVSSDLYAHPVGYFAESVLTALFRQASDSLELIAYVSRECSDETGKKIRACCQDWEVVDSLSDEALARRIHSDGIDILIDLAGHTAGSRLPAFAWKPAPVQVSWLGYFATTGLAAVDYLIADPWTLPESEEQYFAESIWRLPETRLCFTPPDVDVGVSSLPAMKNRFITFGCFNNLSKINDSVVTLWARVLQAVPGSCLLLKARQLILPSVNDSIVDRFRSCGIGRERLILEGAVPRADYLAAYRRVDVVLDPFPYPGGTTTAEALWMGLPVLTLAGNSFLARQGVGLLMNAGMPEWIAMDADDYVRRAVRHTADLPGLAALRNALRQQVLASPLFDAPRFSRHFATAMRGMWNRWCAARQ